MTMEQVKERARTLHAQATVIDSCQFVQNLVSPRVCADYFLGRYGKELRTAGITAISLTVGHCRSTPVEYLKCISTILELVDAHGDKFSLVRSAKDIERAKREGKVGIIFASQGENQIGEDLRLLRVYKELGVRIMQPAYYRQTQFGEGCFERTDAGLSNLGLAFVKEMNKLHMAIDMSHCGYKTTMDTIECSQDPVLITHSSARSLCDHRRNKSDEQIRAMAKKGGVIGVTAYTTFCEIKKGVDPTFEDFMTIVDYVVQLVGPNHVGIGLDVDHEGSETYAPWVIENPEIPGRFPWAKRNIFCDEQGWIDVTVWHRFTEWMLAHKYSDDDVRKILGGNFLRVFKEIWGD